jgi:polyhydroxyalkanoate synthesis regulator phasin
VLAGKRIKWAVPIAAFAAVLVAGCGGGGGSTASTATSAEPLSKQELVAKGDAICQQSREQFRQLQQNAPTTAEGAAAFTQKLIDISETQLDQLRDLNPPASVKASLDDYLKALEKNIAVLKQGLKAAQQNDATGYAKAQAKAVRGQVQRLELARAVGFKQCSLPAGTASSTSG